MRRSVYVAGTVLVAVGVAFAVFNRNSGDSTSAAHAQGAPPRGIAPRVSVATAAATSRDLTITQRAVGWVEPVATVVIKPRIDGVVVEQSVRDGQMVKAGDLLFRLDDRAIRAAIAKDEAQILRDEALKRQASNDAARTKSLLERSVATKQLADQTEANAKATSAAVQADHAQLEADQVQLSYTVIRAPISGRVGIVNTSIGNLVRASDANGLLSIVQVAPVRVSFAVPERELDAFRAALAKPEGTPVKIYVRGVDDEARAVGKLSFIDNTVDNVTGTFTAKAEVPNQNGELWPGQYISAHVVLGLRKGVTVVPLVAVQEGPEGPYVFLVKDQKVEMRKIALIETRGQEAVIATGVVPGDRVVVEGQGSLRDGSLIRETARGTTPQASRSP